LHKTTTKLIRKIKSPFLPKAIAVSIFDHQDVEFHRVYPPDTYEMPLLKDVFGNEHPGFQPYSCVIPAAYVAVISNGRCVIGREEVYTHENGCVLEITSQKQNPGIGHPVATNASKVKGVVANLSLSGLENNYYHFCVEWMARFHLLQRSGIDVDYYIFPQELSFQKQYAELLKIDRQKIISLDEGCYIEAEQLVAPSFINNWKDVKFRGHESYSKQWLPKWIGGVYENIRIDEDNHEDAKENRIYISRSLAHHRKAENEAEIIETLKKFGFSVHCLEKMTVEQQIGLFRNARFVVSIHGAGLVNISHCKSSAIVLEIYPEYYHDSGLKLQVHALGHQYEYMIGRTANTKIHPKQENVYIDPLELEKAISLIQKGTSYSSKDKFG